MIQEINQRLTISCYCPCNCFDLVAIHLCYIRSYFTNISRRIRIINTLFKVQISLTSNFFLSTTSKNESLILPLICTYLLRNNVKSRNPSTPPRTLHSKINETTEDIITKIQRYTCKFTYKS